MERPDDEDLYERLEREALFEMPDEADEEPALDVIEAATGETGQKDQPAADLTLGGYHALHERPPAFEGIDGLPYTVDVDTEATNDPDRAVRGLLRFPALGSYRRRHNGSRGIE